MRTSRRAFWWESFRSKAARILRTEPAHSVTQHRLSFDKLNEFHHFLQYLINLPFPSFSLPLALLGLQSVKKGSSVLEFSVQTVSAIVEHRWLIMNAVQGFRDL